ncbi:D-amino-acid transaminase [Brochothrix thermosphacta]|uniref:D-amino-acid transaminase n=1 Tax=Brochothrix thermosphacta TaxID=2756 RepID=UPI0003E86649|nr:D-amino-acid transaminase [Brochothrix thermosphacta]EUJ38537.1 D-amino acid aminotransferase [Brochothrix thermosphacta DSM 20171 = FSL F6-1036]ODJ47997.1 D-amino-acid transaminase [Brochothrix thermosphacta DSM 20171 = FSL F6-1036]
MKVLVKDQIINSADANVSISDRGYQFGDGIYEVIRVLNGKLFTEKEHMDRFYSSAEKMDLVMPYDREKLTTLIYDLIKANNVVDGHVYFQLTRGVQEPRNHAFPDDVEAVLTGHTKIYKRDLAMLEEGVSTVTADDVRWLRCDIKTLNLIGNCMAKTKAAKVGAEEAILHRDGLVTECSASTLLIVKDGVVKTHPLTNLVLPGITRMVIMDAIADANIPVKEEAFMLDELFQADEAILASTGHDATPIIEIDGKPVGNGKRGLITAEIQRRYDLRIEQECGKA